VDLIGLSRRHHFCKICNCFNDETLNDITIDLLQGKLTHQEIIDKYTPLLPTGFDDLTITSTNLSSHKRHSDPGLIAEELLKRKKQPVSNGDHAAILYAERYKERIDKQNVLHALYKSRINTVQYLRDLLIDKQNEYNECKGADKEDKDYYKIVSRMKVLENDIRSYIKQIDNIETDLQQVVLQDLRVEKGPGNTYINQNIVNVVEDNLKGFMQEFIPYLLYKVFPNDIEKGKEVVSQLSGYMDKHLTPTIKRLNQSNMSLN